MSVFLIWLIFRVMCTLNSIAHSFCILGCQKLPCFLNFLASRTRPEKLCSFYWLQRIRCKTARYVHVECRFGKPFFIVLERWCHCAGLQKDGGAKSKQILPSLSHWNSGGSSSRMLVKKGQNNKIIIYTTRQ